jgi:hypothetical protein
MLVNKIPILIKKNSTFRKRIFFHDSFFLNFAIFLAMNSTKVYAA